LAEKETTRAAKTSHKEFMHDYLGVG
jgi:hypothetical protein